MDCDPLDDVVDLVIAETLGIDYKLRVMEIVGTDGDARIPTSESHDKSGGVHICLYLVDGDDNRRDRTISLCRT